MERFLHVQVVFYKVLLQENEVIKNDFNIPYCINYFEDLLLFLSKKAIFFGSLFSS